MNRLVTWRNLYRLIMLGTAALVMWCTLTVDGRTSAKTALLLPSLIPGSPVRPIEAFTESPSKQAVVFSEGDLSWEGDLYLPGTKGPHPGIVVALGVNPLSRNDERVIRLGQGLARMGVATLLPVSENLVNKRISVQEVDFMVSAFTFLSQHPEVDADRVGFVGICVGASLAMLAAQEDRIANQVRFVNWFGGYYRLDELIVSVATHSYEKDGVRLSWVPDRLTDEVVRLRAIEFVEDAGERDRLSRSLIGGVPLAHEERIGLSATGTLVYELFNNPNPRQARTMLLQLPRETLELVSRLSPATKASSSRANIYVMGDTKDRLVPYVQTLQLADAVGKDLVKHTEFTIFSHADLNRLANPLRSVPEMWALYSHMTAIFGSLL